jgi:very-short-patch-repair endonuclease
MKLESCKSWRERAKSIKTTYAAEMRENLSLPEALLWEKLCKKQLGVKFRRQVIIRGYIVDFYCPSRRLAVEVDGKQHKPEYDQLRDRAINLSKVRVIRFPASQVFNDMDAVIEEISFNILSKAARAAIR